MDEDLENYMEEVLKCLSVQSKSQEKMSAQPLLPPLLSFIVNSQQKEEENEFLNQMQDSFEENQVVEEEEENQVVEEEEEENQIIEEEEVKPTNVGEVTKETFKNLEVEENNEPQFNFPIVKSQEKVEQPSFAIPTSSTTSMKEVLLLKESPCESMEENPSIATPLESFTPSPINTTTITTITTMDVFPEKDDTPLEINNIVNTPLVHSNSTMMDESIVNTPPVRGISITPEHERKRKRNETREHCLIFLEEFKKTLNQYNNHLCEIIFENKEMNQENDSTISELDLFKEEEEEEEECGICLLELYDETPIVF
jgi:hypothetical protein